MGDTTDSETLSQRNSQLKNNQSNWFGSQLETTKDRCGETIVIDGNRVDSIPGFFLVLGEAVNGANGYFGACLDSLSDCLCGGFGLALPLTVVIHNARIAKENLGLKAMADWDLLRGHKITNFSDTDSEMNPGLAYRANVHYFDQIMSVFLDAGVEVKLIP